MSAVDRDARSSTGNGDGFARVHHELEYIEERTQQEERRYHQTDARHGRSSPRVGSPTARSGATHVQVALHSEQQREPHGDHVERTRQVAREQRVRSAPADSEEFGVVAERVEMQVDGRRRERRERVAHRKRCQNGVRRTPHSAPHENTAREAVSQQSQERHSGQHREHCAQSANKDNSGEVKKKGSL